MTSKEVLERTGISRATLNNYIATGLLPRPEVLPPNPQDGDAPRIGYFPPDTIERIAEIQRRKREGWSIAQIAAHFAGAPKAESIGAAAPQEQGQSPAAVAPAGPPSSAVAGPVAVPPIGGGPAALPVPSIPAPVLSPVSVLVSTLENATRLWLMLPAREYFELVHEVWRALDGIYRRHGGRHSRHPAEGMVCHFLPRHDTDHLWSSLRAACQSRAAMRALSLRWQERKGWDVQLNLNTGIDEGREWLSPLRLAEPVEVVVVGGAAERARQLSRLAPPGAIWVTRNLLDRLDSSHRSRVVYGVPRADADPQARLLGAFAPLAELSGRTGSPAPPDDLRDWPVAELVDLAEGTASANAAAAEQNDRK